MSDWRDQRIDHLRKRVEKLEQRNEELEINERRQFAIQLAPCMMLRRSEPGYTDDGALEAAVRLADKLSHILDTWDGEHISTKSNEED